MKMIEWLQNLQSLWKLPLGAGIGGEKKKKRHGENSMWKERKKRKKDGETEDYYGGLR